jgi:tRNA (guanine37-N1)-methyltransferase
MIFSAISIFPEMFTCLTKYGITGRAFNKSICQLEVINPRDFVSDPYHRIDDTTFGGGAGMIMKQEPLALSLGGAIAQQKILGVANPLKVYLSAQGVAINQKLINQLVRNESGIIFICGRYEGVDERFIDRNIDLEVSIGDLVVSGGELPAMMLMDAIIRHLPNVMNNSSSVDEESFMNGMLDYPHYTQPAVYNGVAVPDVLLSGNHEQIKLWRLQMSLWRTYTRRPDLFAKLILTKLESGLLSKLISRNKMEKQ